MIPVAAEESGYQVGQIKGLVPKCPPSRICRFSIGLDVIR